MTYKNKSAGNKVSEVLLDEPSGLSRGKLQFDYFLLLHCSEATTQPSFPKCISRQMFFFPNMLHLRGENNFVILAIGEASLKVTSFKNHFRICYVDKMSGSYNQEILCKSEWIWTDFNLLGNEFYSINVEIIPCKASWGSYVLKMFNFFIKSLFSINPWSILEGKTIPCTPWEFWFEYFVALSFMDKSRVAPYKYSPYKEF